MDYFEIVYGIFIIKNDVPNKNISKEIHVGKMSTCFLHFIYSIKYIFKATHFLLHDISRTIRDEKEKYLMLHRYLSGAADLLFRR